jgi:hypothetical protein
LASIAVDELGLDESEIKIIQDDFEDNGLLDNLNKEGLSQKEVLIKKITDQYKTATTTIYNNARRLYKEKTKPTPSKPESLSKYQFDELMRQKELQTTSVFLKPVSKFLSSQPISEGQAKSLIEYANNTIPGIEIYQNSQTDDDGNLLNPNAYVIEVNGKQKPFIIGKTPGMAIDKFIKDLFGYTANDRLNMFNTEKNADEKTEDEFSEYKEEPTRYEIEQKTIEDITSGRYDRNEALQEKLNEEKENKLIDTLKRNFKTGRITQEYLTGPGKPIYDNWKKTGGEIDLSLRSN